MSLKNLWKTPKTDIHPYHPNCVSGGGGEEYEWDGIYENAETHTYKGRYVNYVKYSRSIFKDTPPTKEEIEDFGLVDYPDFPSDQPDTDAVLISPLIAHKYPLEQINEALQTNLKMEGLKIAIDNIDEVIKISPAYKWTMDPTVPVDDPLELFPVTMIEVNGEE